MLNSLSQKHINSIKFIILYIFLHFCGQWMSDIRWKNFFEQFFSKSGIFKGAPFTIKGRSKGEQGASYIDFEISQILKILTPPRGFGFHILSVLKYMCIFFIEILNFRWKFSWKKCDLHLEIDNLWRWSTCVVVTRTVGNTFC